MAEFRFDIKPLFPQPIIRVTSNLLPHTFKGDRRQALDATSKMSEIIDRLGQLSAVSQKLTKPVTTAQRLRMSENQTVYLLADTSEGHNGAVLGLLKVGTKDLYLFDEVGQTRKILNAPCILDFYIHESRQRAGLGRSLFETMLAEEKWSPIRCSIDRPSDKLLGFFKKHYGLSRTIPQANNFVLYEGFFDEMNDGPRLREQTNGLHITDSPNTLLFGAHHTGGDVDRRRRQPNAPTIPAQLTQISPVGRYGARRPTCSMAEIIHAGSAAKQGATPGSLSSQRQQQQQHQPAQQEPDVESLTAQLHHLQAAAAQAVADEAAAVAEYLEAEAAELASHITEEEQVAVTPPKEENNNSARSKTPNSHMAAGQVKKPSTFHLSKQHTGMKNISFGVGMAVTPTNKMEFDQEAREEFGVVKINRPIGKLNSPSADNGDNMSTVSSTGEGLTDQGYYDLKFYHNKLW